MVSHFALKRVNAPNFAAVLACLTVTMVVTNFDFRFENRGICSSLPPTSPCVSKPNLVYSYQLLATVLGLIVFVGTERTGAALLPE